MAIPDDHQSENPEFDPDFSSPREIAAYYRFKNLNPIPAKGKRPAVDWKDYQNILVPQEVFEGWYNPENGTHKANGNVGTLLGRGKFMVDLDTYKPGGDAATNWYNGQLAVHNNRRNWKRGSRSPERVAASCSLNVHPAGGRQTSPQRFLWT